jgi:hypothetical protein
MLTITLIYVHKKLIDNDLFVSENILNEAACSFAGELAVA